MIILSTWILKQKGKDQKRKGKWQIRVKIKFIKIIRNKVITSVEIKVLTPSILKSFNA